MSERWNRDIMPDTLGRWRAEHVNFTKLLDILEQQLRLFREGASPNYEMMLDIMYYMTHYPDVLHHPKEDLVSRCSGNVTAISWAGSKRSASSTFR